MKKNFKFTLALTIFIIIVLLMMILYKIILGYTINQVIASDKYIYLLIVFILLGVIYLYNISLNNAEKDTKEIEDYYKNIRMHVLGENLIVENEKNDNVENQTDYNTSDILELMSLNMREIKEYYILSKTMAKRSFNLSIVMCILGFFTISSSIVGIFLKDINFMEALVPVIGGSIVEVIAGTSFVVYKKSLEQLNQYFESLHNNERFLSVVSLVSKLTESKKDDVYINIINNQLEILKKNN